ncbi:MAG: hypothetical protein LBQ11_02575 [Candidatus Nomurabacteria bacterium]|jgi:hypothetical protein|nr:hypothetical protein [Candidatus Nomurabacteria bacterium]
MAGLEELSNLREKELSAVAAMDNYSEVIGLSFFRSRNGRILNITDSSGVRKQVPEGIGQTIVGLNRAFLKARKERLAECVTKCAFHCACQEGSRCVFTENVIGAGSNIDTTKTSYIPGVAKIMLRGTK